VGFWGGPRASHALVRDRLRKAGRGGEDAPGHVHRIQGIELQFRNQKKTASLAMAIAQPGFFIFWQPCAPAFPPCLQRASPRQAQFRDAPKGIPSPGYNL